MRIDRRVAAGLLVIVGVVLGSALVISLVKGSDADETARYEVTVQFNTTVTQDDLDEAGSLLRTFDEDVDFLIMEIFPPIGRAVLVTDAPDFCRTVEAALEAKSYVNSVSCQQWQEPDQADPDAPVSTDNRASSGSEAAQYEVTVRFNTTVTQDDMDEADALLRTFDDGVEFLIMEIFPPIGRAVLATDAPDFCPTVKAALEAERYVDGASCRLWQEPDQTEPDAPVTTNNDPNS